MFWLSHTKRLIVENGRDLSMWKKAITHSGTYPEIVEEHRSYSFCPTCYSGIVCIAHNSGIPGQTGSFLRQICIQSFRFQDRKIAIHLDFLLRPDKTTLFPSKNAAQPGDELWKWEYVFKTLAIQTKYIINRHLWPGHFVFSNRTSEQACLFNWPFNGQFVKRIKTVQWTK